MEQAITTKEYRSISFKSAVFTLGIIAAAIIIAYGLDSVAPNAHEAFHDFRHVIGMPCH